jgi:hypothetical protein
MTSQEMADRILDLIASYEDTTFPEIMRSIGEEARGNHAIESRPNTFLWAGISKNLFDSFALIKDKLDVHRCSFMVSALDGSILNFPIAKSIPKDGYKEPHWLPVILRYRDKKEAAERLALLRQQNPRLTGKRLC